jgi:hypothetical protein
MDATLMMITKDLGIHNAAWDETLKAFQVVADAVRFAQSAYRTYEVAVSLAATATDTMSASDAAAIVWGMAVTATTDAETTSVLGLAGAFDVLNASMGPLGWIALAGGLIAAGAVGYAAAGGFSGGQQQEGPTNIYMQNAYMRNEAEGTATAQALSTALHTQRKAYGR